MDPRELSVVQDRVAGKKPVQAFSQDHCGDGGGWDK